MVFAQVRGKNWYFPVTPNFFPSQLRQIQFEDKVDKEIRVWQQEAHTKRNTVQEGKSVSVFEISIFESYLIVFVYSDMNMYYCIFFSRRIREISWRASLCSFLRWLHHPCCHLDHRDKTLSHLIIFVYILHFPELENNDGQSDKLSGLEILRTFVSQSDQKSVF